VGGEVEQGGQTRFVTKRELGNFNALMDMYVIELAELMPVFDSFLQGCQPVNKRTMVKQVSSLNFKSFCNFYPNDWTRGH
jgi:hypothetical protein